jgi:hypothetical protein
MVGPLSEREKALPGRQGWLFLQGDTNDVIGQHTGRVRLGREARREWKALLEARVAWTREFGIPWVCQIAPDKESVYPEYLPPEIVPSRRRPVHELLRAARSLKPPMTYPLQELVAAKDDWPLYFPTDTHWTQRGAYVAYLALCQELEGRGLRPRVVRDETVSWVKQSHYGDLGSKLDPPVEGPGLAAQLEHHSSRLVFDNRIENHGRVMIFEQDRPAESTCVAFGESFTNQLLLFLKESFRRLVFVHTSMMIREVVTRETPDVVISLPLERFLIRVPDDRNALATLTDTIGRKLARGDLRDFPGMYLRGCPSPGAVALERQLGTSPWQPTDTG